MAQQVARQPGALQIAISSDELINYMTDSEKFGDQPNVNAQDDQTVVDKLALLAYAFPQLASQPDMVTPAAYRENGPRGQGRGERMGRDPRGRRGRYDNYGPGPWRLGRFTPDGPWQDGPGGGPGGMGWAY